MQLPKRRNGTAPATGLNALTSQKVHPALLLAP